MVTKNSSSSSICSHFCKVYKMWTYEEGGVLEGGGLRRALTVHRHPSLERRGFADVARRQSEVLDIEGAGREKENKVCASSTCFIYNVR